MTAKEKIKWMKHNGYLPRWLLPLNRMKDGNPYAGHPVGNITKFMPLYSSINFDILHSLSMHSVLRCYILDGEENNNKERNMWFSYSTPREIARGLKRVWYSQRLGTNSSARIIQDVDLALKDLEIVYHANGAAVEGLADRNGHRRKEVCEGKSVSWGGAQTKGEGRKCKLTNNMFFHNDLFQLCLKKNVTSLSSYDTTVLNGKKIVLRTNEIKR